MNAVSETIQTLKQLLDSEEQSEELTRLPRDTYRSTAAYVQKLRKSVDVGSTDPSSKLAKKQLWLIEGMGRQLFSSRLVKVTNTGDSKLLLPEEKYVYELHLEFERTCREFIHAIANGHTSVYALLERNQMRKMVTVSFQRPLGEIVGFDLNRYGPFKAHDVAQLPAANAEALISNGDVRMVYASDTD